jgi:hypothetical protein
MAGSAWAAQSGAGASGWAVGYYTPAGRALSEAEAAPLTGGVATFDFTDLANTALFITDQGSQKGTLLGNLTGETLSATFELASVDAAVVYYGESSCGGTGAYVRLFFETSSSGGFNETHYWWSNPASFDLSTLGNGVKATVTASLGSPEDWSDYSGHFGNNPNYAAGYQAAVANVTAVGLSFGGGCFFENGIGTTDGLGSFELNAFSVTAAA